MKLEVENELTAKEQIILDQAKRLEDKTNAELTMKDQELIEAGKKLAERDAAAKEAQKMQDQKQTELDDLAKENQQLKSEVEALENKIKQAEDAYNSAMAGARAQANCGTDCSIM